MARENPTSPPSGILTFLAGLLLLAIVAVLIVTWVRNTVPRDTVAEKRADARRAAREKLDQQYAAQLSSVGWVDKAKGTVHVPIGDAMKLAVTELQGKKAIASTVKVEAFLPPITIDPKSTEPPPVALPSAPQGALNVRFDIPEATGHPAVVAPAPAPAPVVPAPAAAPVAPTAPAPAAIPAPPVAPPAPDHPPVAPVAVPPAPAPVPPPPLAPATPVPPVIAPPPVAPPAPLPVEPAVPPAPAPSVPPPAAPAPAAAPEAPQSPAPAPEAPASAPAPAPAPAAN